MSLFSILPKYWWMKVKETFCEHCGKMTPARQYQGHFACAICEKLTGFWIFISEYDINGRGPYKDIPGVKRWSDKVNENGVHYLVPVSYTLMED
jgi:hypothetical protein